MAISSQLSYEILEQLRDDILSYGWLCQMVRDQKPDASKKEVDGIIENSCRLLLEKKQIVIGNAVLVGEIIEIHPFSSNTNESLRLISDIMRTSDPRSNPEDSDRFWIGPVVYGHSI